MSAPPQPPERQQVLTGLAALLGGSLEVLAIHQRGPTPFVEVVLWLEDSHNLGRIDRDEYGDCQSCDEPINPKRLEFDPTATLCVNCASELDR